MVKHFLIHGRLWHGSHNNGENVARRYCLIATADTPPILISDFNHLEWPFRFSINTLSSQGGLERAKVEI